MLRNDLITLLAEKDNDAVAVDIGGIHVDVDAVSVDRGTIVLMLDPEELHHTVRQVAARPASGAGGLEVSADPR